ncbi:hypothetical protein J3R83DRAFT_12055 [Lanmaoa asiatica]|nr:hypothetical protein J3R83DRAFT_12055 [Lanmaoa asiatica]
MESGFEPLKVTFFPPLYHQRRIWILDILRRERLAEVRAITRTDGFDLTGHYHWYKYIDPRYWMWRRRPPRNALPARPMAETEPLSRRRRRAVLALLERLDIASSQLEIATQYTSPASVNPLYTRWEPLDVEIWQGSVDAINPAFVNVQCIVASELIEHLADDVLVQVAPIVLGVYQPRVFLVTTPSYTFNRRWSPPGAADPKGHLDPTGRSDRVFRHSDHKFEWTVDEFVQWCKSVANQWGYAVETATIGIPKEQDPWGRDGVLGGATQVASFRRLEDHFSKAVRERGAQAVHNTTKGLHTLVGRHRHEAHPRAGYPSDPVEIEEAMVLKFQEWRETSLEVQELWFADNLPILCGGSIEVMLNVSEQSTKLELRRVAGQRRGNWKIQLLGGLTHQFPEQITPMGSENIIWEDDELDYDEGESSFDSGVRMGTSYDSTPWCPEVIGWTQTSGDGNSWAMD